MPILITYGVASHIARLAPHHGADVRIHLLFTMERFRHSRRAANCVSQARCCTLPPPFASMHAAYMPISPGQDVSMLLNALPSLVRWEERGIFHSNRRREWKCATSHLHITYKWTLCNTTQEAKVSARAHNVKASVSRVVSATQHRSSSLSIACSPHRI